MLYGSAVPAGLGMFIALIPPLKRWAIFFRPAGLGEWPHIVIEFKVRLIVCLISKCHGQHCAVKKIIHAPVAGMTVAGHRVRAGFVNVVIAIAWQQRAEAG